MSWFKTFWSKTRVLQHADKYVVQAKWFPIPFWFEVMSSPRQQELYDDEEFEEDERRRNSCRYVAQSHARQNHGRFLGMQDYLTPRDQFRFWLRKRLSFLEGPTGMPGPPGNTGAMGIMGPAYDDLKCPHCGIFRSFIHPPVALKLDHYGDDKPLVYTCHGYKCGKTSNWIAYNGIFLNEHAITKHDQGNEQPKPETAG